MEHNDYKIHHDDYFSLWTGNGGTIVGAGFNDETRNPMPYNLDNGMFAVARLDQPIETFRWHIIVLHSKTWLQAGDRVVEEYGGVNLVRVQSPQLTNRQLIFPLKAQKDN